MEDKKKPKPKLEPKTLVVKIPGQKSAQDTSNWEDKSFGTPKGRDLIPAMADVSKDPNYTRSHREPKEHIGTLENE